MDLLNPVGPISAHEKTLILVAFWIMLAVAIPVFVMTFYFAWRYRASNKKAPYLPNWDFSWKIDIVIWALPIIIVIALGVISWQTTHSLAPYRPLASDKKPINVDVVSLDWKWLFIYPDQHIASVNKLVLPVGHPVHFRLTSATVMTSFSIPRMGSQIYAMAGMRTQLNLLADKVGTYYGHNMQFSGRGYSDMNFTVQVQQPNEYQSWVQRVSKLHKKLDQKVLTNLEKPSVNDDVTYYSSVSEDMFQSIINKFDGDSGSTI